MDAINQFSDIWRYDNIALNEQNGSFGPLLVCASFCLKYFSPNLRPLFPFRYAIQRYWSICLSVFYQCLWLSLSLSSYTQYFPFLFFSLSFSISPFPSHSSCLSFYVCPYPCLHVSVCVQVSASTSLYLSLFLYLCLTLSLFPSLSISAPLFLYLSLSLSISVSLSLSKSISL